MSDDFKDKLIRYLALTIKDIQADLREAWDEHRKLKELKQKKEARLIIEKMKKPLWTRIVYGDLIDIINKGDIL